MNTIIKKQLLAPGVFEIIVNNPLIARKAEPGHFVIFRTHDKGERIPVTISDFDRDKGTITIVFQGMGKSSKLLGDLKVGEKILDLLGPQGNPTEVGRYGHVVVIGGGIGLAPVYPLARKLKALGNEVTAVVGYRSKDFVFWEEKIRSVADRVIITTNDGSYGNKGFVTDSVKTMIADGQKIDKVFAIGPAVMMKAVVDVTKPANIPTIVSLNSLMVCGMGMCGACRVTVGGKVLFTCMDGPDFDGAKVDFTELMQRLDTYKAEEKRADGL
jgi:ferredoxin--NADP+ reductase